MTTSPGQIWAEKFSRSVSKISRGKRFALCSLQHPDIDGSAPPLLAPLITHTLIAPLYLIDKFLERGVSCAHVFLQIKYIENCMKLGLSSGIFTESFCHHVSQISHRFWEGWPNYCKHCQRHNGPEGWVHLIKVTTWGHITSSNTNLDQIHLQNLD